jgi:putative transposase
MATHRASAKGAAPGLSLTPPSEEGGYSNRIDRASAKWCSARVESKPRPLKEGGYSNGHDAASTTRCRIRAMTRLRRIEDRDRIFFITFNVERGIAPLSNAERDLVLDTVQTLRRPGDFALYGYVIMPDHAHLLLRPKTVSLIRIMRDLKSRTGFALCKSRNVRGPFWQRSYFDFICRRTRDFSAKLEYIHQNPGSAGLVDQPQNWPWSSYRHYARLGDAPLVPDFIDFSGDPNELLWPAPWRPL